MTSIDKAERSKTPCVYRFFNSDGILLYVGCTIALLSRLQNHRTLPWYSEISNITIEHVATRADALAVEMAAIKSESPLYNLEGTGYERKREKEDFTPEELDRIKRAGENYDPLPWMDKPYVKLQRLWAMGKEEKRINEEKRTRWRMVKAKEILAASKPKEGA